MWLCCERCSHGVSRAHHVLRFIHGEEQHGMHEHRPNILWLNTDHYAYAHHVALNRDLLRTPAFDRLCAEGVRFDNAYTVTPLCTPARASLVTGQYPHRHGILNNDGHWGSRTKFKEDAPLWSHALRSAGYRAAFFGKWHAEGPSGTTAQNRGWEGLTMPGYGFPYGSPEYTAYLGEHGLPDPEVEIEWHLHDGHKRGRVRLADTSSFEYHESCGVLDAPVEAHEAYFLAHLANRYLEARARDGEAFCLRVDPWAPHQPYYVAAPFANTVDPRSIPPYPSFGHTLRDRPAHHRLFHDQITQNTGMRTWDDWQPVVARCYEHIALVEHALTTMLETLDRLGLADNTLVLYSADHGDIIGAHGGMFDKGWLMVEETMRIPLLMRWPQQIASGVRSHALLSNLDLVATIRDAVGAPADRGDGTSLLPLAHAPDAAVWRDDLMLESHGHYGDRVFQRMLRWRNWKYVAHLDDRDELYDLDDDPYELHNRSLDPAAQEIRRALQARLLTQMDRFDDDAPDAQRLRAQLAV
jgi:arylsulfatase A-like enzyme